MGTKTTTVTTSWCDICQKSVDLKDLHVREVAPCRVKKIGIELWYSGTFLATDICWICSRKIVDFIQEMLRKESESCPKSFTDWKLE